MISDVIISDVIIIKAMISDVANNIIKPMISDVIIITLLRPSRL